MIEAMAPSQINPSICIDGESRTALIAGMKIVDPEIQKAFPFFELIYTHPDPSSHQTPGSGTGIHMLLKGELAFSQSSRELKPEEEQQNLKQIPVGIDGIVFAVNPKLNIPGLTVDHQKRTTGSPLQTPACQSCRLPYISQRA